MNLNIFKRIAYLETQMLQLYAGRSALSDRLADLEKHMGWQNSLIERLINEHKTALIELKAALKKVQSRPRKPSTEKAKAYARAYYAKKKAKKLAASVAA